MTDRHAHRIALACRAELSAAAGGYVVGHAPVLGRERTAAKRRRHVERALLTRIGRQSRPPMTTGKLKSPCESASFHRAFRRDAEPRSFEQADLGAVHSALDRPMATLGMGDLDHTTDHALSVSPSGLRAIVDTGNSGGLLGLLSAVFRPPVRAGHYLLEIGQPKKDGNVSVDDVRNAPFATAFRLYARPHRNRRI
jgi:hypothetical protein